MPDSNEPITVSSLQEKAALRVEERKRAKTDRFFLANDVLGYEFQEAHAELFALYPKFDETKSWSEQIKDWEDIMVLWSRGHFKSTAVKVIIIQAILNNPNITILVQQGNMKLTQIFVEDIAKHFRGEHFGSRLQELFPEFCGIEIEKVIDKSTGHTVKEWKFGKKVLNNTAHGFTVPCRKTSTPQATVTVASPRSIKTGQHYMLGIFDDLQNESNWRNDKQVQKVLDDFMGCQPLLQGAARWVTGTRWTHGDLYEQIMRWDKKQKWTTSIKTCWSDDGKSVRLPLFIKKNGEESGFTTEQLLELQEADPAFFACQYLNKPVHSSKQAFTKELLDEALIAADAAPGLSECLFCVDLASAENENADDSVIQVGRIDNLGTAYLCDQRGGQWAPYETAINVIDLAIRYRPVKIMLEGTASCKYFIAYLQNVARQKNIYLPIDEIKVNNKTDAKNIRVLGLAGMVKKGRFKLFRGLPKYDKLVEQAIQFPKNRHGHDDYIDTAALLYGELVKQMLTLPVRPVPRNSILALVSDRENSLAQSLVADQQQVPAADFTGLD